MIKMKLNGIEISGIDRIVVKENGKEDVIWRKLNNVWYTPKTQVDNLFDRTTSHSDRVSFIKWASAHPERYKVWIRESTVNIRIFSTTPSKGTEFVMTNCGDFVEVKTDA